VVKHAFQLLLDLYVLDKTSVVIGGVHLLVFKWIFFT
jgi:hypothetical protein